MPRRSTTFISGHYYHLYNRGVNRQKIFFNQGNYKHLKSLLRKNVVKYNIDIVAFCLMPNHYHLLIKPNENNNVSICIQSVFSSYSQAINQQQRRHGHLFQGRFRSIQIKDEATLVHLARYIHLNPVAAGINSDPYAWKHSNYCDLIDHRNTILRDMTLIPNLFSCGPKYRKFIEEYFDSEAQTSENLKKYAIDCE